MRIDRHLTKTLMSAALISAGLMLGACAPQYKNHGYVPLQEDLDQLTIGQDTRDTVTAMAGAPAASGLLDSSSFYYVRSRRRALGFLAPKEIEREVVAIRFSDNGVVENVERFGLERGNVIALDRRVTSSSVKDKAFIRQLLGNIGRFNPAGLGG
ncbi:Beta-barrel assembly machine subunit BamE [Sulfitobacter marinus]|uniref:Beta-barrel assembly machine subunit BamE n=1 Tax=Sulfitobacter marinus TaxID=394264 RepID=A0A1I6QXD0_9RHOB|nr:outer membrane protein assembly factor BamE [Sulfitobacter marinus]SFS57062.1 Beta-barrel assembly machine subunit BamE [Sulfitobacter marinus]